MQIQTLWRIAIPRIVLGTIFVVAVNYFWSVAFGRTLMPVPITSAAMQFAGVIIKIGYL